jgi:hypothetical protein
MELLTENFENLNNKGIGIPSIKILTQNGQLKVLFSEFNREQIWWHFCDLRSRNKTITFSEFKNFEISRESLRFESPSHSLQSEKSVFAPSHDITSNDENIEQ